MKVKVKTDMILARAKEAWCGKQGFTSEGTKTVFVTWQGRRIFDHTKIQRLGLQINNGFVTVKDDPTIYDEDNLPKIHVEAWTEEVWKKRKEEDALEAAKAKNDIIEVEEQPEPEPEQEPEAKQLRLFLKAKGKDDYKIKVRGVSYPILILERAMLTIHADHNSRTAHKCVQTEPRHPQRATDNANVGWRPLEPFGRH